MALAWKMKASRIIPIVCAIFAIGGCDDGHLRGAVSVSADGKSNFTFADNNGGHCDPLLLDGKNWEQPLHTLVEIKPGAHRAQCGHGDVGISFEVPPNSVFEFDYWGP